MSSRQLRCLGALTIVAATIWPRALAFGLKAAVEGGKQRSDEPGASKRLAGQPPRGRITSRTSPKTPRLILKKAICPRLLPLSNRAA
jgi:hypothetical protein